MYIYIYIYIERERERDRKRLVRGLGGRRPPARGRQVAAPPREQATYVLQKQAKGPQSWVALLVQRYLSDMASVVFYSMTCLMWLIYFAIWFATFEEQMC